MNLPKRYPAIRINGTGGGPEVLQFCDQSLEMPHAHQVLIEVKAFGINRPDIFQRKGQYPAPMGVPADIPGLEVSGVIVACGPNVEKFQIGDAVCALLGGGGYAAYALADERHGLLLSDPNTSDVPKHPHMSFEQAAAIPETLFTVWHNVFQLGRLHAGQKLLVHGGSGGIGTTAIKLATFKGAEVYATAGSSSRAQACLELGAHACVSYQDQDFEEVFNSLRFDVILDSIGGPYFNKNLNLLADDGTLVQINATQGKRVELDLLKMMVRRWHITGSTLRSRDAEFKSALRQAIQDNIWDEFLKPESTLLPVLDRVLPADQIQEAHRALEQGEIFGKIVLKW